MASGRPARYSGRATWFVPWDTGGEHEQLPITVDWLVLEPIRTAVLDRAFALRVTDWPSIPARRIGGFVQRACYLAVVHAVTRA